MGERSRTRASDQRQPNWDLGVKVKLWVWQFWGVKGELLTVFWYLPSHPHRPPRSWQLGSSSPLRWVIGALKEPVLPALRRRWESLPSRLGCGERRTWGRHPASSSPGRLLSKASAAFCPSPCGWCWDRENPGDQSLGKLLNAEVSHETRRGWSKITACRNLANSSHPGLTALGMGRGGTCAAAGGGGWGGVRLRFPLPL